MKITVLVFLMACSLAGAGQIEKFIPQKPTPIRLVNDYTKTLTDSQTSDLEQKLMNFREATTNEIAVVIIPTTNGYAIEDVALAIFRNWKPGLVTKNNGVVLLVAKNDRKLRIQTGYGLEGALPDIKCSQIIKEDIKPAFKKGDFNKGIDDGITAMINTIDPSYNNNTDGIDSSTSLGDDTLYPRQTLAGNDNNTYQQAEPEKSKDGIGLWWLIPVLMFGSFFYLAYKFGIRSNGNDSQNDRFDNNNFSSSSDTSFSSDSSSDNSSSDFGGGDSGGGGSSGSW